jgi:hypothetical protein
MAAPVSVVFGHFAGAQASLGVSQSGFDALVKLVRSGKAYVNISGVLSLFKSSAEYRCRTACVGTDSCYPTTHSVGIRLAAPRFIAGGKPPARLTLRRCSKLIMAVYSTNSPCGHQMRMCEKRFWSRTLPGCITFEPCSIQVAAASVHRVPIQCVVCSATQ